MVSCIIATYLIIFSYFILFCFVCYYVNYKELRVERITIELCNLFEDRLAVAGFGPND